MVPQKQISTNISFHDGVLRQKLHRVIKCIQKQMKSMKMTCWRLLPPPSPPPLDRRERHHGIIFSHTREYTRHDTANYQYHCTLAQRKYTFNWFHMIRFQANVVRPRFFQCVFIASIIIVMLVQVCSDFNISPIRGLHCRTYGKHQRHSRTYLIKHRCDWSVYWWRYTTCR